MASRRVDRNASFTRGVAAPDRGVGRAIRARVAEGTIKRHLANVYSKVGVHSRGEAMREALAGD